MKLIPSRYWYEKRIIRQERILAIVAILALVLWLTPYTATYEKSLAVEVVDPIEKTLEALAFCESSNRPFAVNTKEVHGMSFGLLQFSIDTFNHFGERYGLLHNDIFNVEQQRAIAAEMLKEGRTEHWENCL